MTSGGGSGLVRHPGPAIGTVGRSGNERAQPLRRIVNLRNSSREQRSMLARLRIPARTEAEGRQRLARSRRPPGGDRHHQGRPLRDRPEQATSACLLASENRGGQEGRNSLPAMQLCFRIPAPPPSPPGALARWPAAQTSAAAKRSRSCAVSSAGASCCRQGLGKGLPEPRDASARARSCGGISAARCSGAGPTVWSPAVEEAGLAWLEVPTRTVKPSQNAAAGDAELGAQRIWPGAGQVWRDRRSGPVELEARNSTPSKLALWQGAPRGT